MRKSIWNVKVFLALQEWKFNSKTGPRLWLASLLDLAAKQCCSTDQWQFQWGQAWAVCLWYHLDIDCICGCYRACLWLVDARHSFWSFLSVKLDSSKLDIRLKPTWACHIVVCWECMCCNWLPLVPTNFTGYQANTAASSARLLTWIMVMV